MDSTQDRPQGQTQVLHQERLWPSASIWAAVPVLGGLFALATLPTGVVPAVVAGLVSAGLVAALLWRTSPRVEVTATTLRAGRATIPRTDLGAAVGYEGEEARYQRGPVLDARAHVLMRGWADGVVRVDVVDPQDPTPYWLVSTRRPAALARVLGGGMATAPVDHPGSTTA